MSRTKEQLDDKDNKELDFKHQEHEQEKSLNMKMVGLHGGTKIHEERETEYLITEVHWNPEIREIVILHTWIEDAGEGDPSYKSEVIRTINNVSEFIEYATHN